MAVKTGTCFSFIVLNNFFANMCEKNCASPTRSLTARRWYYITIRVVCLPVCSLFSRKRDLDCFA